MNKNPSRSVNEKEQIKIFSCKNGGTDVTWKTVV